LRIATNSCGDSLTLSGITIAPAAAFYPGQAAQNAFRLAFTRYPEDVLARAAMILGRLLEAMLKDHNRGG